MRAAEKQGSQRQSGPEQNHPVQSREKPAKWRLERGRCVSHITLDIYQLHRIVLLDLISR